MKKGAKSKVQAEGEVKGDTSEAVKLQKANNDDVAGIKASGSEPSPISTSKRMLLCLFYTIFGLVFFYLVMVFFSSISKDIVLDRMPVNGWARNASKHTALVTSIVLCLFMISSPASLLSLFLAVMAACAQFCHFVIISSDLTIYVDREIAVHIFRDPDQHPIFNVLPLYTAHVLGTIGFFSFLVITTERCFGSSMRLRRPALPKESLFAASYIMAVFSLWLLDRFAKIIRDVFLLGLDPEFIDIAAPLLFLLPLWFSHSVMWGRVAHSKTLEHKKEKEN